VTERLRDGWTYLITNRKRVSSRKRFFSTNVPKSVPETLPAPQWLRMPHGRQWPGFGLIVIGSATFAGAARMRPAWSKIDARSDSVWQPISYRLQLIC